MKKEKSPKGRDEHGNDVSPPRQSDNQSEEGEVKVNLTLYTMSFGKVVQIWLEAIYFTGCLLI